MKQSLHFIRRKQAGITLVETAIALAIAAVVVSAAFAGFQANARRSEVRDNSQLISEMIADTKQLFGPSNRYSLLKTDAAIAARIVPNNLIVGTDEARNSYGGKITFASADGGNDQAVMVFSKVPKNQCADLVLSVERPVVSVRIEAHTDDAAATGAPAENDDRVTTGHGVVKNGIHTTPAARSISVDSVTAACNADGEDKQIELYFARN